MKQRIAKKIVKKVRVVNYSTAQFKEAWLSLTPKNRAQMMKLFRAEVRKYEK